MYFQGWSPRKYIQHEGGTIPCTVKTMRQLTIPYKANHQINFGSRMSVLQYVLYGAICTAYSTVRTLGAVVHCIA